MRVHVLTRVETRHFAEELYSFWIAPFMSLSYLDPIIRSSDQSILIPGSISKSDTPKVPLERDHRPLPRRRWLRPRLRRGADERCRAEGCLPAGEGWRASVPGLVVSINGRRESSGVIPMQWQAQQSLPVPFSVGSSSSLTIGDFLYSVCAILRSFCLPVLG